MSVAYSFVVDGTAKLEWQAACLVYNLFSIGIPPQDIHCHVTPTVSEAFRSFAADRFVKLIPIDPFPDHVYCNKLQQTHTVFDDEYENVVLCDCDVSFAEQLPSSVFEADAVGRVVDRPNPPLDLLDAIYARHGIDPSPIVPVGVPHTESERTRATNWNGGLYVFRRDFLTALGARWRGIAEDLIENIHLFARYANHVDQVSLALALDESNANWASLPESHNIPVHLAPAAAGVSHDVGSIHYHDKMTSAGRISPVGDEPLDQAIEKINRTFRQDLHPCVVSDPNVFALLSSFQHSHASMTQEQLEATRVAFQNPRYLRHNARRLEHLASLGLDLTGRTVLEFGAGIGDHSEFFLDRDCEVLAIEPRAENIEFLKGRHARHPTFDTPRRIRAIQCTEAESFSFIGDAKFEIVYNYGLLYHLDEPEKFLRLSASACASLYLLETAVADLVAKKTSYDEPVEEPTNSFDGGCKLLHRAEIMGILREELPYVYTATVGPAHEQFLRDWTRPPPQFPRRYRAVFVGSRTKIDLPFLAESI